MVSLMVVGFFFSSRRRHTRCGRDWSSDVYSSDLVVQVDEHRCQRAGRVEHAFLRTADCSVQVVLVTRQRLPLEVALVVAHQHLLAHGDQGHGGLYARYVGHAPFELVDGIHGLVGRAHFRRGIDHHHQDVGTGRVVVDDEVVIQVVARVRTQLGRTRIQVTDFQVGLLIEEATYRRQQTGDHHDRSYLGVGDIGQEAPERMLAAGVIPGTIDRTLADAHIGNRYRQHDQVGEHDHRHTHRSTDGQLVNHADIQYQQRDEAHRVSQDGDHARQEQLAEGTTGRNQCAVGITGKQSDTVDLLYTVGNTDGEDQEGHQH